ncbi:MAG: hypothetical protein FVQ77_07730 [Cytophagales bacterium]|nr:hypothetical protein [Cytophagales bacterium]
MKNLKLFCIGLIILVLTLSSGVNAQTITYSESFTTGVTYCPGDPQYDNWGLFRSQLDTTAFNFTTVTIKGSNDVVGRSCTNAAFVNQMAISLRNGVVGTWACGGFSFNVGIGCFAGGCAVPADAIEFTADGSVCACLTPGYSLRPCIGNTNKGGVNTATCSSPTQTMTVIFEYSLLSDIIVSNDSICIGDTVFLSVDVIDSTQLIPPYTYLWSPPSFLDCDTCQSVMSIPGSTINYKVVVTDSAGTQDSSDVTITVFLIAPIADAVPDDSICTGDSVQLNASGGVSYLWSPGNSLSDSTISNPLASPGTTTAYIVDVANPCGFDLDTITITVIPLPIANAGPDDSICLGDSAQLTASGGVSYLWSPGIGLSDPTIANPTASHSSTTTYIVEVSSSFGCVNTDSVIVNVINKPVKATADPPLFCFGDTTIIQLFVSLCAAFLEDFESGASGWTATSLWHLETTQSNSPTTSFTYNTGSPNYNYDTGLNSGTLTSSPIDLTNASPSDSIKLTFYGFYETETPGTIWDQRWVQISLNGGPFTNIVQLFGETMNTWHQHQIDLSTYVGNMIQIRFFFNTIDGVANNFWGWSIDDFEISCAGAVVDTTLSYKWTPSTGLSNDTIQNPVAAVGQVITYTVVVTDTFACVVSDSVTITENTPISLTITGSVNVQCAGDSTGSATVTPAGGIPPYTYQWNDSVITNNITGLNYTGTVVNDAGTGTLPWLTPNQAEGSLNDNIWAEAAGFGANEISNFLKATNYGFAITNSDSIQGIEMAVEWHKSGGTITDDQIFLVVGGVIQTGAVNQANGTLLSDPFDGIATYGGPLDTWGTTLSEVDVNNIGFGVAIAVTKVGGGLAQTAFVDRIFIRIYYTTRGQTTQTATGLPAGTYQVVVTDVIGCSDSVSVTITEPPANDVGVIALDTPLTNCGLSATESVTIRVVNFGSVIQIGVPVSYSLDGGLPENEIIDTINPCDTVTYTFAATANLSTPGIHTFDAWTTLITDADSANDSLTNFLVENTLIVTTFPYLENFETGQGGWSSGGINSTWAFGTPAKTTIDSAGSGVNSWVTGGLGLGFYNSLENSQVVSPCFDFTSLIAPIIELNIWWNSEFSWDGAVLQSSINGGASWQNVGAFGDPDNWYNDNTISGLFWTGNTEGWSGRISTGNGSGGWVIAIHDLTGLGGQSSVVFRIAFGSNGIFADEGFAFDDVYIHDRPANDAGVIAIDAPNTGCSLSDSESVTIRVRNFGTSLQDTIPVSYRINAGAPVNETITDTINPGDTLSFTFTTTADLATTGIYIFDAWTSLSGDTNYSNDSVLNYAVSSNLNFIESVCIYDFDGGFGDTTCSNFTSDLCTDGFDGPGDLTLKSSDTFLLSVSCIDSISYNLYFTQCGIADTTNFIFYLNGVPIDTFTNTTTTCTCTPFNYPVLFTITDTALLNSAYNFGVNALSVQHDGLNMYIAGYTADIFARCTACSTIPLTTSIIGTNESCNSACDGIADLAVAGGILPYSYSWSNGDSTEDISGLCSGFYSVLITDSDGSTITDSITIGSDSPSTKLNLTVFLEGPYSGGSMYDSLNNKGELNGYLADSAGGYYNINMNSGYSIPVNAVDVIELVLRDAASPSGPNVDTTYAWLLSDGTVRDFKTGDSSYVNFCAAPAGYYYMIVRHRNHLSIMSSDTVNITNAVPGSTPSTGYIDLTVIGNIYGGGAAFLGGSYGMWAANARNTDQETNANDLYDVSVDRYLLLQGYILTDVDLTGAVNGSDFNITSTHNDQLYWSTVP